MSERTDPSGGIAVAERHEPGAEDLAGQTIDQGPPPPTGKIERPRRRVPEESMSPGIRATMNTLSDYTLALNMRRRSDDLLAALRPAQRGGFFDHHVEPELPDVTNLSADNIDELYYDFPIQLLAQSDQEHATEVSNWRDAMARTLAERHLPLAATALAEEAKEQADELLADPHQEPRNKLRAHYEGAIDAMIAAGVFASIEQQEALKATLETYDRDRKVQIALEEHLHKLQSRNPGRVAVALWVRKGWRMGTAVVTAPLVGLYTKLNSAHTRNMTAGEVTNWRRSKVVIGGLALGAILGWQAARGRLVPLFMPDVELPEEADPRRIGSPTHGASQGAGSGLEPGVPVDQNPGGGTGSEKGEPTPEPVIPPQTSEPIEITSGIRWDQIFDKAGVKYSQEFMAYAWDDTIAPSGYGYIEGDLDADFVDYRVNQEDGQIPGTLVDQLKAKYDEFQKLQAVRSVAAL